MTARDNYPLPSPHANDPWFTGRLVEDVARVIESHGYPPVDDLLGLDGKLYDFLFGAHR